MADDEVTDDPTTWPEWLRAERDRAEQAVREVRRRRREVERNKTQKETDQ